MHSRLEKVPVVKLVKGHQQYVADALYEYSVNGQQYTGKRISPWVVVATHNMRAVLVKQLLKIRKDPNGSIDVFYNPADPKKSFLVKPGIVGQLVTVAAGLASAIVYMAKYH
jgi:hypothetical protein